MGAGDACGDCRVIDVLAQTVRFAGGVALVRHPDDRDILLALVSYSRDAGDFGTALEYAERMACVTPGDPGLVALIEKLRQQAKEPGTR